MSGIYGVVDFKGVRIEEAFIRRLVGTQRNIRTDDIEIFVEKNVGFGFVGTRVIEISSDKYQPLYSEDKRYVLVFDGRIYNYIELRDELTSKGYVFKTKTDGEVLLQSYIEWGEECLHKFNGMWAFVIYDREKESLFGARDRYGIKPFYYALSNNRVVFASDINALVKVLKNELSINNQAVLDYLVFNRTDQTNETFYDNIKKIPHGHKINTNESAFLIEKWYKLEERLTQPYLSSEEYLDDFVSSIKLRLRSEVPIGVCLSGGIDSSSIVSTIMHKFDDVDIATFSAIYEKGDEGDESQFIDIYKEHLTNMYFTKPTAQSLLDDLESFIYAIGEPIASTGPYAQYKVMELAKDKVMVTLDGQGADEQLAGYHYFFGFYFKELVKKGKLLTFFNELSHYFKNHKSLLGLKSFVFFFLPAQLMAKLRAGEHHYLNNDFSNQYLKSNQISGNLYTASSLQDSLVNHFEFKLEHLLKWEDRSSKHFSLEARVPFLDYRLVERTLATRSSLIIKNGHTKHILREAMKDILPEAIRTRKDKIGFGTPQNEWFRTPVWQDKILEVLEQRCLVEYIDTQKARLLYERHLNREANVAKEIWKWVNLCYWLQGLRN